MWSGGPDKCSTVYYVGPVELYRGVDDLRGVLPKCKCPAPSRFADRAHDSVSAFCVSTGVAAFPGEKPHSQAGEVGVVLRFDTGETWLMRRAPPLGLGDGQAARSTNRRT